ncbi:T/G mismatch-specific endonuclease [Geodermatophilus poikilotrophus]|uniref:T/G mismatch-specific endonuclease n=2 Tax=Geodermatophilus poikilotrophus TaxID=1333667 RepID=A0A1I0IMH8_9ACTN|nr:T/G mismatch-specific endonuclease [Geodermatophilus poikilotrophus]
MVANRGRDTAPELAVRRLVHARGLRYFVGRPPLKGLRRTADLLFPRRRLAVFIDGCFWHRCPEHFQMPAANRDYWEPKIARNVERDRETDRRLAEAGWRVLRCWEHEDPEGVADLIERAVREVAQP